jgi:hypothetical protein
MDIQIVERASGAIIGTYPVELLGQNYVPNEEEFFDLTWRCAVDDGAVQKSDRGAYEFRTVNNS